MYDLIYLILVLYAIKIFVIKLGKYNLKKKSVSVINTKEVDNKVTIKINILNRLKKIINNFKEKNNTFIISNKKSYEEDEEKKRAEEQWQESRHMALEKAKYKCEECGNITNLEVYSKSGESVSVNYDELIVLCKKCHEGYEKQAIIH